MARTKDGSVISSYFNVKPTMSGADVKNQGAETLVGQIEKVHYVDDPTNVSKEFVEYDVSVRNQQGGQTVYKNVKSSVSSLGGYNDRSEIILEPNEVALEGKLSTSNIFSNKNGTFVYLAFKDNSLDKPYIASTAEHPKKVGSKREKGINLSYEFRGLQWSINKLGELDVTYNGNRKPNGELEREESGPTSIKIDQEGDLTISNKAGQEFKISRKDNTVTLNFESGLKISVDGENDDITLQTKDSAKLNLNADKVALGVSGGEELLDLVSQLAQTVSDIANANAIETHPTAVGPTGPPDNASDYNTAKSEADDIKSKVDNIKGSV